MEVKEQERKKGMEKEEEVIRKGKGDVKDEDGRREGGGGGTDSQVGLRSAGCVAKPVRKKWEVHGGARTPAHEEEALHHMRRRISRNSLTLELDYTP